MPAPAPIALTPIALTGARRFELIALFGLLTVFTPIAVDLYMPAFPAMAREFGTPVATIEHSLAAYFLGMALGQAAIGIMTLTPGETAMIAGDFATKAADVRIGFLDRFSGALVLHGSVGAVEEALAQTCAALGRLLDYSVCPVTRS